MIIGNTQSVSIPFLFLFFVHQSSLYPITLFTSMYTNCTDLYTHTNLYIVQICTHIQIVQMFTLRHCTNLKIIIGKYGSTSYIGMTREKIAANRKGIGPTTLKRACNSTTNTHTKYLSVVMHKTLCSVWLNFVQRENETVQNCPIVLKNSSSSYYF